MVGDRDKEIANLAKEYYIQILDGATDQIVYFDRMKTYRSAQRIITSLTPVKKYRTRQVAESAAEQVREYYHGEHLIEVVERDIAERDTDDCIF